MLHFLQQQMNLISFGSLPITMILKISENESSYEFKTGSFQSSTILCVVTGGMPCR